MMKNKTDLLFYLAYGSNLNLTHMKTRCPGAKPVGTAVLPGRRLVFRGAARGYYLTLEPAPGFETPVGLWDVPAADSPALDYYEGYPDFYEKEFLSELSYRDLEGRPGVQGAYLYLMREGYAYGLPTEEYMLACQEGFRDFGFDPALLQAAYEYTRSKMD